MNNKENTKASINNHKKNVKVTLSSGNQLVVNDGITEYVLASKHKDTVKFFMENVTVLGDALVKAKRETIHDKNLIRALEAELDFCSKQINKRDGQISNNIVIGGSDNDDALMLETIRLLYSDVQFTEEEIRESESRSKREATAYRTRNPFETK